MFKSCFLLGNIPRPMRLSSKWSLIHWHLASEPLTCTCPATSYASTSKHLALQLTGSLGVGTMLCIPFNPSYLYDHLNVWLISLWRQRSRLYITWLCITYFWVPEHSEFMLCPSLTRVFIIDDHLISIFNFELLGAEKLYDREFLTLAPLLLLRTTGHIWVPGRFPSPHSQSGKGRAWVLSIL